MKGLLSVKSRASVDPAAVAAVAWCACLFGILAGRVGDPGMKSLDERVMLWFRTGGDPALPVGPFWLPGAMRDWTSLGSAPVLVLLSLFVIGALLVRRRYEAVGFLVVTVLGGRLGNALLKDLFERARPDLGLHITDVRSSSFPSGHAMDSTVVYLTLALLLGRFVAPVLKGYLLALAGVLTALVGVSRVYLGVHYPSDVLAGWAAGLGWALLCWTVSRSRPEPEEPRRLSGQVGF